jgi:hypothetical protein
MICAGCELLGPAEDMPSAEVTGSVQLAGQPLTGGWVELMPIEGAIGHLRSGPIGPDGRFKISGAAVGKNAVRLVNPAAPGLPAVVLGVPMRRFEDYTNPMRRNLKSGLNGPIDIDLLDEAAKFTTRSPQR